jgi:hypothetical protein
MRVLRRLAALATGFVALTALVLPTMASASSSAPEQAPFVVQQVNPTTYIAPVSNTVKVSPLIAPIKICTRSGTVRCATGKGIGYQFQMQVSGYSTFNEILGTQGDVYETPNGLCPQAKDAANGYIVIGNNGCSDTNTSYEWASTSNGRLENPTYSRYLGVLFNNQDGAKTTTQPSTGAYYLQPYAS